MANGRHFRTPPPKPVRQPPPPDSTGRDALASKHRARSAQAVRRVAAIRQRSASPKAQSGFEELPQEPVRAWIPPGPLRRVAPAQFLMNAAERDCEIDDDAFFGIEAVGDFRSKYGVQKNTDGSTYIGRVIEGAREGYGTLIFGNGVFEGQFKNGLAHGKGRLNFKNGDVFTGLFHENRKHGYGFYQWADGALEEGDYHKGKKNGWHRWRRGRDGWHSRYENGVIVEAWNRPVTDEEYGVAAKKCDTVTHSGSLDSRRISKGEPGLEHIGSAEERRWKEEERKEARAARKKRQEDACYMQPRTPRLSKPPEQPMDLQLGREGQWSPQKGKRLGWCCSSPSQSDVRVDTSTSTTVQSRPASKRRAQSARNGRSQGQTAAVRQKAAIISKAVEKVQVGTDLELVDLDTTALAATVPQTAVAADVTQMPHAAAADVAELAPIGAAAKAEEADAAEAATASAMADVTQVAEASEVAEEEHHADTF